MKNLLLLEWKRCFHRIEFRFTFGFFLVVAIGAFVDTCRAYYGRPLTLIRSAWDMSMMQGIEGHVWLSMELLLLPLLASILFSDSYYSDLRSGVYQTTLTRARACSVIWAKFIINFVVVFLAVLIPLMVNQRLCLSAFPTVGFDNNFGVPPYDIDVHNYTPSYLFDLLRVQSPPLYNLLYMFIISGFAALLASVTFALYFILKKGKFMTLTSVYLLFIAEEFAFTALGWRSFTLYNTMTPNVIASPPQLYVWGIGLLATSLLLVFLYSRRHESGLVN
jgi:hypothetical protein